SAIDFPPPMRDTPPLGTFVVVALNPENSLAVLDDATVESAARQMTPGRRLVMVDMVSPLELAVRSEYNCSNAMYLKFYPVGSGFPKDARACVPISPAIAHPEGRTPIHPSQPLPVGNAYLH
ncbi:hypothetical protein AURDEDRAFT_34459, partial [Auricularia subglabra TFB-10046 SS5]